MPYKVERLVQSKHISDRWYVELTGGESIKANVAIIADFSLYSGCELTDEEYEELKAAASRMNAKARALRILGTRSLSKKELYDRLVEKGETEEDSAEAVDILEALGFLDDSEYAASIVRHYSQRGYGAGRIKNELYRRGVPRELWDEALSDMPEDTEAIDALIARRLGSGSTDRKELKRTTDMLLRRGFSWEQIKSALRRCEFSEEQDFYG
ncbi:MAG: regulatory protein RecX [Oscillospiraceae bacterium]